MQIVIDIPEIIKKRADDFVGKYELDAVDLMILIDRVKEGIIIPDNATNGDVIKTLFKPNWIRRMDDVVREEYEFDAEWWNAPYKKGGKDADSN